MSVRIGITQRVSCVREYGERRDCLDQRWARVAQELGAIPLPLSNAVERVDDYVAALDLHGVILSGGNDIAALEGALDLAPERDEFERKLIECCVASKVPIVGICRGMQVLNLYFGGQLHRRNGHAATRHSIQGDGWRRDVNSFHNWAIGPGDLGGGLRVVANASDGAVEAFSHSHYGCFGFMWHPERESRLDPLDACWLRRIFYKKE